jgi:hypothetical protein
MEPFYERSRPPITANLPGSTGAARAENLFAFVFLPWFSIFPIGSRMDLQAAKNKSSATHSS